MIMSTRVVIDTNVALKWIPGKGEEQVDLARKVYERIKTGEMEMWTSDYLLVEALQVFLKKRLMPLAKAGEAVEALRSCGLYFKPIEAENLGEVAKISHNFNQSVYDAMFLHLAKKMDCPLVTFDERIWKRCEWAMEPGRFLDKVNLSG